MEGFEQPPNLALAKPRFIPLQQSWVGHPVHGVDTPVTYGIRPQVAFVAVR